MFSSEWRKCLSSCTEQIQPDRKLARCTLSMFQNKTPGADSTAIQSQKTEQQTHLKQTDDKMI